MTVAHSSLRGYREKLSLSQRRKDSISREGLFFIMLNPLPNPLPRRGNETLKRTDRDSEINSE